MRFKKDIQEDVSGLDFIKALRPVSYQLDSNKIHSFMKSKNSVSPKKALSEKRTGFIAQEVEQVIKDQGYRFTGVRTPKNENDHYGLRYAEFVVPLVKAVQEQQEIIETLQQEIALLKNQGSALTNGFNTYDQAKNAEDFALYQNIPNPFDKTTAIEAVIPEHVQQAKIIVYNLQGLELESYAIAKRGNVTVEISGGRFPSGMYLYALLADGRVIDTKKMILTK